MSSRITKIARKARKAREREKLCLQELSYHFLPDGELCRAFRSAFPGCEPLLLPHEDGHRGVVCINCGNCLMRKPNGELVEGELDLNQLFETEAEWIS
ncbi:hypothetical protein ES703_48186 [subsurface metagenome]